MSKYYSQYGQDEFLNEFVFRNKKGGVFIDIGANDGITISNTYFFERELSWKGICFEPLAKTFKKLDANRNSINVNGCAAAKNYTDVFFSIDGYGEMLSGLKSQYDPRHLDRIAKEIAAFGGSIDEVEVECYDVNELILNNNLANIDFISIDIEGGELSILKNLNYDLIKIKAIVVENNYADPEFNHFLSAKGFCLIKRLGGDEIYLHPRNFGGTRSFFVRLKIKWGGLYEKLTSFTKKPVGAL
jgi:FkbM family methyltransferase